MVGKEELRRRLARIDGRGYKAYRDIEGDYDFGDFRLFIDHVQGDPFAPPSLVRVRVPQGVAGFPTALFATRPRCVALADYLTRECGRLSRMVAHRRGTGFGGLITIASCGQEILERTAVVINEDYVEARIGVGLPARGRTVMGREAEAMFFEEIPALVAGALMYARLDPAAVARHVETAEDQHDLRRQMAAAGLVTFVADGAILPRESGASDRPLPSERAVAFVSPPELRTAFVLPNRGRITGMGIPAGVTLIVGGGYHGKSTLLRAIERGVYDHIPGDGREFVLTVEDAVKIRAEDGRAVTGVDISGFINNLPDGQDTRTFSTASASGSTSQAANIAEALEVGTSLLLIDEDTSATNFMVRDARMQRLVAKDKEPITPFIDRVRQLYEERGVSTILVVGGSGDYFDVADRVIMMENYRPRDVTAAAREIARALGADRQQEVTGPLTGPAERVLIPGCWRLGERDKVKARDLYEIAFGKETIDLSHVEQLVDPGQTRAIAVILRRMGAYADGRRSLREVLDAIMEEVARRGLDAIAGRQGEHPGQLARPRRYEIAAAINRYRNLRVRQRKRTG